MTHKPKFDPSWHITGNYPTRECKPADRGDETCWLVSLPRGFEPLQIAVWGDGVYYADACEAACEWLLKIHPNAASSSDEENSSARLLNKEERKSFQEIAPQSGFSALSPGPWEVKGTSVCNSQAEICRVPNQDSESIANLHLIAVAPEMIGLLSDAVEDAGFSLSGPTDHREAEDGEPKWVCRAREVIAKAYAVPSKPAQVAPPLPEPSPAKKTR